MNYEITPKQMQFINAASDEVLFGGAAGGGKSFAQVIDSLLFGVKYPGSRQLILRKSFPELERSIINTTLLIFPKEVGRYSSTKRIWSLHNGSVLEFGYCDQENDVIKYQSAEYDVIRFDELTHFTEFQYLYLLSRIRGTNGYPKQMKSTTNPGGVGHSWVKKRFIDPCPPMQERVDAKGRSLIFIPAKIGDNCFLMKSDPNYVGRLMELPESQQKALLYGIWDIFEGQFFGEFDRELHVVQPFVIPAHWRRYMAMDYGLDMLACYWAAFDTLGYCYVYRELYQSGLTVSEAAQRIKAASPAEEQIYLRFAPPDLWGRGADTGKSIAELFAERGLLLTRVSAMREAGWMNLKEWLKPFADERGIKTAKLKIFACCTNLIRTLPALCYDKQNPKDASLHPHELTHAPDAIRYLLAGRPRGDEEEEGEEDGQLRRFLEY